MEMVIKSFTCVLRHTHHADDIINNINALSNGTTRASDISDNDRLGILDFPDNATQDANVAATTSLSRVELIERAASSPSELSVEEYCLLRDRFWLNLSEPEEKSKRAAQYTISASEEVYWQVTGQLKKVRAMLHDNNEEVAILNADNEQWRRMRVEREKRDRLSVESRLPTAQPWVKRLWEEDQGKRIWGYAVYYAPGTVDEEYQCRIDLRLHSTLTNAGCASTMSRRFRLQHLDWPDSPMLNQEPLPEPVDDESERAVPGRPGLFRGTWQPPNIYTSSQLEDRFQALRQHFTATRDHASGEQGTASESQTGHGGLQGGMLRNVFLVIDQQCVRHVLDTRGHPDDPWVYAVDPDYLQSAHAATTEPSPNEYRGYLRVRVTQLCNNFFDARKYHEDEFPMQVLWEAAQSNWHKTFVSVKKAE